MSKNPLNLNWKSEIIPLAVIIACIASSFFFYANFPQTVASHWNFNGEVDGWSSKAFGAFFIPILLLLIYLLMIIMPYFDPKKERYADFSKPYSIFRMMIITILGLIYFVTGFYNLGYAINVGVITAASIGLMMIIIGNYLGKIKKNWFVGVRTPWTLSSENVWNKTHRLSGKMFMLWGLTIIIAPWLPPILGATLFIAGIILVLAGSTLYSYILFKKEKNEN
jgi:uncharacterized membrane protein